MKTLLIAIAVAASTISLPSCTTTYDAYGRPVQSVDPGAAAAGAAAAGVVGYAIGRSDDDRRHYYYGGRRHRGHWGYRHGRRGYWRR